MKSTDGRSRFMAIASRGLRGGVHVAKMASSQVRIAWLRIKFPGLRIESSVIQAGCDIYVAAGSTLVIRGCHVARGVGITVGPKATMVIDADFIGPYSQIVARESVTIGQGSKVAERVTIRDGNHDHSVLLSAMKFTSAPVRIEEDVWLGANSVILAGVTIERSATVGAGAVVTRSVAEGDTVGGVPARRIGSRAAHHEGGK